MEMEIRLLGGFSAHRNGEEIPSGAFGGRLARRLLRILLTRRGGFLSRDFLTEALWPRTPPADPVMNLNVLVKRARRGLGAPDLILTGPGGYSFARTERCVVDAEQFLAGVESARGLLPAGWALGTLRVALDRWGGEPLPEDTYEDWAQEYRTRLLRARLEALAGGRGSPPSGRSPAGHRPRGARRDPGAPAGGRSPALRAGPRRLGRRRRCSGGAR